MACKPGDGKVGRRGRGGGLCFFSCVSGLCMVVCDGVVVVFVSVCVGGGCMVVCDGVVVVVCECVRVCVWGVVYGGV